MVVLLVEDSDDTREFIAFLLNMNGYDVIEALDGREAVDLAFNEKPDVILMDLNLPIVSGWEATRTIKSMPEMENVPVIAISAQCTGEWKEAVMAAGAVDCLQKPLDQKILFETITRHKS